MEIESLFGGTWIVGETITVTVGSKSFTYTTASTVIATILTGLSTALQALSATAYPEFARQTWGADATHLTATAVNAGQPIAFTISTNSAGGTVGATTTVTANAGPNSYGTAANWSLGTVPVSTNDVIFDDPTYPCLYDLNQSGVTLASLTFSPHWTADLGLPFVDSLGVVEFLPTYLQTSATLLNCNCPSNRMKVNVGSAACTGYIDQTGQSTDGYAAFMFLGTSASNAISILNGELGVAMASGETANLSGGLVVGPGATVTTGKSCTLATVTQYGGTLTINGAVGTSFKGEGGTCLIQGVGAVAAVALTGGCYLIYNTTGTLGGNPTIDASTIDFEQDIQPKTVTNSFTARGGGSVFDSLQLVGNLRVISTDGTAQVRWGPAWTLTRS